MKRFLVLILALMMSLSLAACGGAADNSNVPVQDIKTTESTSVIETEQNEIKLEKQSYHSAEILSCEIIKDSDGDDAIAVHLNWTNGGEESESFFLASLDTTMYQDGIELEWAYPDYELENILTLYENQDLNLRPGTSLEVVCCAKLRNTTSTIEIEVYDTSWDFVMDSVLLAAGEYNFK